MTHEGVLCYKENGAFEGMVRTENRPLAVLCQDAKPLILTQGQVCVLDPKAAPAQTEPSAAPDSVSAPVSSAPPESEPISEAPPET